MDFHEFIDKYKIKLNSQQEEAVKAIDGPCLLLAVPGSGKTTVLLEIIDHFLGHRGGRVDI